MGQRAEEPAAASWDDLRVFLHVARAGTMTGAARTLGVSQTTVARRLETLQSSLGPLVDRSGPHLELTALGREMLPHAEAADANVRALLRCADKPRAAEVCLATTLGLATHLLAPALPRLLAAAPEVRLTVRTGVPRLDVMRREADVSLRMGGPGDDRLVGSRVGTVACGLYASEAYLSARGEPPSVSALAGHRVLESDGSLASVPQVEALRRAAQDATVAFHSDNVTFQRQALEHGAGIGTVPCFMVEPSRGLRRILRKAFDVHVDLWLLVNPALRKRPAIRRLLTALREELRQQADRLAGRS